jgi:hypothetical protein
MPVDPNDLLFNSTLNRVYPPMPAALLPDKDARDYALAKLREYLCALVFQRTGDVNGPTIPFSLPKDSIQIQQPDDIKNLPLPGIGIIPGRGVHESIGLGPPVVIESSKDIAGPGTALLRNGDYVEPVTIEVWGSKSAERRALVAGLKSALRASDGSYGIYLLLPEYYNMTAEFALNESQYIDGDEVSRNRRRAHLMVTMRVCEVTLTNVNDLNSSLETTVLDGNLGIGIDC